MLKFDPNQPHGEIRGDVHGRCFEQDGHHFNADGDLWTPDQSPVGVDNAEAALRARIEKEVRAKVEAEMRVKITAEMTAKTTKAAPAADDQVAAQLGDGDTALESLGLPPKAEAALRGAKIDSVEALCACTEPQLLGLPNIGQGTLGTIKTVLRKAGKKLAG